MWDLCWTEWQWDRVFFSQSTSVFTCHCTVRTPTTRLHLDTVVMKGRSRRSLGVLELRYARLLSGMLLFRILVCWAVILCDDVNRTVPSKRRDVITLLHSVTSQKISILKKVLFWKSGSRGLKSAFSLFLLVSITKAALWRPYLLRWSAWLWMHSALVCTYVLLRLCVLVICWSQQTKTKSKSRLKLGRIAGGHPLIRLAIPAYKTRRGLRRRDLIRELMLTMALTWAY
jgi:hypothetical protein